VPPVDDIPLLCAGEDGAQLRQLLHHRRGPAATSTCFRFPKRRATGCRFRRRPKAVAWLEDLPAKAIAPRSTSTDIEKFGIWPETYEWVFEKGWLTQFVDGVLASPLIRTETFAELSRPREDTGHRVPADHLLHRDESHGPLPRRAPRPITP